MAMTWSRSFVKRRLVAQHGELKVEHQEVETLGLLLFCLYIRGKRGDLRGKLVEVVLLEDSPCLWLGEPLDVQSLRAHDEVVEVHGRHHTVQK